MKITKRWAGVFEQEYMEDLVELDGKYYRPVDRNSKNHEIEEYYKNGYLKDKYTVDDLKSSKEAGNAFADEILQVISIVKPSFKDDFICTCGGDKLGLSHSEYCAKFNQNWK